MIVNANHNANDIMPIELRFDPFRRTGWSEKTEVWLVQARFGHPLKCINFSQLFRYNQTLLKIPVNISAQYINAKYLQISISIMSSNFAVK